MPQPGAASRAVRHGLGLAVFLTVSFAGGSGFDRPARRRRASRDGRHDAVVDELTGPRALSAESFAGTHGQASGQPMGGA